MTDKTKELFLSNIPTGQNNAISMADLARRLGIPSRTVRADILSLRLDGCIIASCPSGYYIPADIGEELHFYLSHRKRAMTNLTALKATRRHLRDMGIDLRGR